MRLAKLRIERQRMLGRRTRFGERRRTRSTRVEGQRNVDIGEPRPREREGGVARDRLLEESDRLGEIRNSALVPEETSLQIQVVRLAIPRRLAARKTRLTGEKFSLERR